MGGAEGQEEEAAVPAEEERRACVGDAAAGGGGSLGGDGEGRRKEARDSITDGPRQGQGMGASSHT